MPRFMMTKQFRNPWALSSAFTFLRTLLLRALGFLNHLVALASASNLYIRSTEKKVGIGTKLHGFANILTFIATLQ